MRQIDLTGRVFGRYTAKEYAGKHKWICCCACGNTRVVFTGNLTRGTSTSCGCIRKEDVIGVCADGLRSHPLYGVWKTMIYRCTKPKRKEYKNYGGRGITVSKEWLIFENFIFDMQPTYKEGYQLDRNDNDGNYEKSNCSWKLPIDNKRNTRATKLNMDKARFIRSSSLGNKELATMFNCSVDSILDVKQYKTWY